MCSHHLGGLVDIHGGGADLIFPHHENEIAQSEAYLGEEPFARYWVHNGWLQLGGEKMSKSLGNVINLSELLQRDLSAEFRLMVLQSHYRAPFTFTEEALSAAQNGLDRLRTAASTGTSADGDPDQRDTELDALITRTDQRFHDAMDDDFNTPVAVAALFDLGRAINREAASGGAAGSVASARTKLRELAGVLGLDVSANKQSSAGDADPFLDLLVEIRTQLREAKQWALADRIRDGLEALGVSVEDTATGTTWRRK